VTSGSPKKTSHASAGGALYAGMAESGEAQAIAWLKQRDARGFDRAYASYAESIFGFLVRLSRSRAYAEDLFQHTFLRLAERGPSLRLDSDLRAWLFTVARNAFHSDVRARNAAARADEHLAYEPRVSGAGPEIGLTLSDLERALDGLEEEDRELLLLVGVEGLNHAQLSAVLAVDEVAVRKRVSRARQRLTEALAALDAEGPLMQTKQSTRGP